MRPFYSDGDLVYYCYTIPYGIENSTITKNEILRNRIIDKTIFVNIVYVKINYINYSTSLFSLLTFKNNTQ